MGIAITKPDKILICAQMLNKYGEQVNIAADCTKVSLRLVVNCTDGKYHFVDSDTWKPGVGHSYVQISHDCMNDFGKIVSSPEEATEFFCQFKPSEPSVTMRLTHCAIAYWSTVSPKGTIKVIRCATGSCCSRVNVDIPLPDNNAIVDDGSDRYDGALYKSCTHWNVADAIKQIWNIAITRLETVRQFCYDEINKENAELATGQKRIDALLKFQNNAKSVEEKIVSTWNNMSLEEKAKALRIAKNEESIKAAKIAKKRKIGKSLTVKKKK